MLLRVYSQGLVTMLYSRIRLNMKTTLKMHSYICVDRIMLLLVCMAHYRKFIIKCNLGLWALREYSMWFSMRPPENDAVIEFILNENI